MKNEKHILKIQIPNAKSIPNFLMSNGFWNSGLGFDLVFLIWILTFGNSL